MNAADAATNLRLARLVELLAAEAPAEAFDRLGEDLPGGANPADRETLLFALARAERIRGRLADRKRRERETHALLQTARELATYHEVDPALDAIVDRARRLLGTDMAYLALAEPGSGEVRMRVTAGTITRSIESVRQPPGRGVGGRVVATAQPFTTSNYLRDRAIVRDPAVTDAVVEEGIVSIVGVPLRVGEEVRGVLFGADREERTFEPSEIALLSSLADHAAVVIENARLFARARDTARQLREANDQVARHSRALERAVAAHERLMSMVLHRADLGELVDAVAEMLDGAVAAVDPHGGLLVAAASPAGDDLAVRLRDMPADPAGPEDREDPEGPGDTAPPDRPGVARRVARPETGASVWAVPIQAGPDTFGRLLFASAADLLGADLRTLERAAQTAALLLLLERQTSAAEQQVRGELVDELLSGREPDWASLERRAKRSGALDLTVPQTVLVLSAAAVPRRRLLRAAADFAAPRGGLSTEHAGRVVLLLPWTDARTAARAVPAQLGRALGVPVTAGAAGPATSGPAVRALHREAERCHRLLVALGRTGSGACVEDLGVLGLVLEGTPRGQVQRLVDDTLGPVASYDAQHGAMLMETLEAYFSAGQNPRTAARMLRVHPNTVYQRLERLDQVLGDRGWREPPGALVTHLALQLRRVLDRVPADAPVGT